MLKSINLAPDAHKIKATIPQGKPFIHFSGIKDDIVVINQYSPSYKRSGIGGQAVVDRISAVHDSMRQESNGNRAEDFFGNYPFCESGVTGGEGKVAHAEMVIGMSVHTYDTGLLNKLIWAPKVVNNVPRLLSRKIYPFINRILPHRQDELRDSDPQKAQQGFDTLWQTLGLDEAEKPTIDWLNEDVGFFWLGPDEELIEFELREKTNNRPKNNELIAKVKELKAGTFDSSAPGKWYIQTFPRYAESYKPHSLDNPLFRISNANTTHGQVNIEWVRDLK